MCLDSERGVVSKIVSKCLNCPLGKRLKKTPYEINRDTVYMGKKYLGVW